MRLIQPNYNEHYYEAYANGQIIGFWPNEDKLIFACWLQDMHDIAIYGCTKRQYNAKNARLADLRAGIKPKPFEYYLAEDTRQRYD